MKLNKTGILFGIVAIIGLLVVFSSYFIVTEGEQVVIRRFGKHVHTIKDAGLKFKVPLIDKAYTFEKRILEWDGHVDEQEPFLTKDKKGIIVDTTARWQIADPLKFLNSFYSEEKAQSRLDDIIDSNLRNVIQKMELIELVRNSNRVLKVIEEEKLSEDSTYVQSIEEDVAQKIKFGRSVITQLVFEQSQKDVAGYGIKLIDVKIKGLVYSDTVLKNVYNRMISQYGIKAQNLRSEGDKKKSEIQGKTELEVKKIKSEAYKLAQIVRGQGDAEATKIYADAYNNGADFYNFQRSLEAYKQSLGKNSNVIIGTESEFFKVFKSGGE